MITWSNFSSNYCKHRGAILEFNKEDGPVMACCFKDERPAESWADWQQCNKKNCPALKEKGEPC